MKKLDFVKLCAAKCNLSQKDMKEVLVGVGEAIVEAMKTEDGVTPFAGMKFYTVHKDARTGRNPQNGEPLVIPAKEAPKVKFGASVKEAVNA